MSDHVSDVSNIPIGPTAFVGPTKPDPFASKGLCDLNEELPESQCFLGDKGRERHIGMFATHVKEIGDRMNAAIGEIKMESLISGGKEESLGLVAGFMIDLAFGPLGKVATKAAASIIGQAAESLVKPAMDAGKKATQNYAKSEAAEQPKAEASKKSSVLDILRNQVNDASLKLQLYGANNADDHQLLRHIQTYKPRSTQDYRAQIEAYLARLEQSDVWNLGRNKATTDRFRMGGLEVTRDVRCVWIVNSVLGTRILYFEKHDGQNTGEAPVLDHLRPDRAGFGNMRNADADARLGEQVPSEFVSLAVERHTEVWGGPPPEYQINTMGQMSKDAKASPQSLQPDTTDSKPAKTAANELPPGSASELHSMYFGQDEQAFDGSGQVAAGAA